MRGVGGWEQAGHNVGIYHFLPFTGVCFFLVYRGDDLNFCEKDTVAVTFPGTVCIFYIMAFSPDAQIAGVYCRIWFQVLGIPFRIYGFYNIFSVRLAVENDAVGEIFCGGKLHLYIFEGGNRVVVSVAVKIYSFYAVDISEIILEVYLIPLGIAIVIAADFFACVDSGVVHFHIAVIFAAVCGCFRIGNASVSVGSRDQALQDIFIHGYGICLDCSGR